MTNNDILTGLNTLLQNANLGYPIGWQGINFTPPALGIWLETAYAPNQPLDNGLAYDSGIVHRGFFQVSVFARSGQGVTVPLGVAHDIAEVFKKGTQVYEAVRIVTAPNVYPPDTTQPDRIEIIVSCEFSG